MKHLILLILLFIGSKSYAQLDSSLFVTDSTKPKYVYCELLGTSKFLSTKITVTVDYGQEVRWWKYNEWIRNNEGKIISFNSMVDALNYMGDFGWEFVQAYVVTIANQNVYHWLLKKKL